MIYTLKTIKHHWNPCRREWQPTPLFLPGEFHGQRSLEPGAWQAVVHGCKESDTTEQLTHTRQ